MNRMLCWGLVVLLISGCAGTKTGKAPEKKEDTGIRGMELLDETFDPADLTEPPLPIKPKNSQKTQTFDNLVKSETADTSRAQTLVGYRIQILQTEDAQEARDVQRDAILELDTDVYLIYDNPYYKVRVGDFAVRYDAEVFLQNVQKKGYSGAWIVRTRISPRPAEQPGSQQ